MATVNKGGRPRKQYIELSEDTLKKILTDAKTGIDENQARSRSLYKTLQSQLLYYIQKLTELESSSERGEGVGDPDEMSISFYNNMVVNISKQMNDIAKNTKDVVEGNLKIAKLITDFIMKKVDTVGEDISLSSSDLVAIEKFMNQNSK